MRRKITLAIVGMVIAALLLAGAGTFLLEQVGARKTTETELRRQAEALTGLFEDTNLFRVLLTTPPATTTGGTTATTTTVPANRNTELQLLIRRIRGLSNLSENDIGILVGPSFERLDGSNPRDIVLDADDLAAIKANPGVAISGHRGRVLFAAAGGEARFLRYVIIVAHPPSNNAKAAFGWFLLASGVTIAVAAIVAIVLSRGLTQRLRAAQAATHAIAAGDLTARVAIAGDAPGGDEVADLAHSINSMAAQLERSRGLERQFLMSVTHDLRTPLTSIQGYAEALADDAIEPQKAAETILAQSARLNRLVTDLLDLAKLDAKSFSLDIGRCEAATVVREAVAAFEPKAAARGITLRVHASGQQFVSADPLRLAQVVTNLVDNALKFARSTIDVSVGPLEGWTAISVADDGPGIAAADLPHVFERLYVARAKPTPKESGSGLGLAIVRELVSAMGGQVAARSPVPETGTGTQMAVYLRPV